MYGEPLQSVPGTKYHYSNLGYILLALVVEKASGKAFIDYLKESVLTPEGVTDVFRARTLRSLRLPNEGFYDDPELGLTVLEPKLDKYVPRAYGGDGWITESGDGAGSLVATATAVVQFIHQHAVWDIGGRAAGARSGVLAGTSSLAVSRKDNVDYAYVFNTRRISTPAQSAFRNRIDKLLDTMVLRDVALDLGAVKPSSPLPLPSKPQ